VPEGRRPQIKPSSQDETEANPHQPNKTPGYQGSGRLRDRVTLITGGDSGIGRAVAIAFAREGADVLISYLSEHENAEDTARWVEKAGRRAVTLAGDIGDESHARSLIKRAVKEFGRLDILVNNAAHQATIDKIEDITAQEWDTTFRTNVYAMFFLCQEAIPHMKPGAAIINTTSID